MKVIQYVWIWNWSVYSRNVQNPFDTSLVWFVPLKKFGLTKTTFAEASCKQIESLFLIKISNIHRFINHQLINVILKNIVFSFV